MPQVGYGGPHKALSQQGKRFLVEGIIVFYAKEQALLSDVGDGVGAGGSPDHAPEEATAPAVLVNQNAGAKAASAADEDGEPACKRARAGQAAPGREVGSILPCAVMVRILKDAHMAAYRGEAHA